MTKAEETVLGVLVRRDLATVDSFMVALHGDAEGSVGSLRVILCNLRKKTKNRGIVIHSRHGGGYFIDRAARLLLRQQVGEGLTGEISEAVRLSNELRKTVGKLRAVTNRFSAALSIADELILDTEKFIFEVKAA